MLALLRKGDCYGYEISSQLAQRIELADGTVYPILRKLKSDGMLDTYLQEESGGPPRKYYQLTPKGEEFLGELENSWQELNDTINHIRNN